MREPCEGKLSCTVLRREGARKGSDLSVTVGLNKQTVAKYIREQETEDMMMDQISLKEYEDPFVHLKKDKTNKKSKQRK